MRYELSEDWEPTNIFRLPIRTVVCMRPDFLLQIQTDFILEQAISCIVMNTNKIVCIIVIYMYIYIYIYIYIYYANVVELLICYTILCF